MDMAKLGFVARLDASQECLQIIFSGIVLAKLAQYQRKEDQDSCHIFRI